METVNKFDNTQEFINWVQQQRRFSKKVSLTKMTYYCELFDHPERKFKSIHVTGTNGKGSTIAMLKTILRSKNLNVATFTSPYITCFNERIAYNDQPIDDVTLLDIGNLILAKYPLILQNNYELPSFFEFITLLAFIYFSTLPKLDLAIIEVGIGGRLDSTNVIKPLMSIISNVALDHMQVLGDSIEAILEEKLGIVKENVPVICGIKDESLQAICRKKALMTNSLIKFPKYDELKIEVVDVNHSLFDYKSYKNLELSLLGFHQIDNALVVIEAFEVLQDLLPKIKLDNENLRFGLKNTKWVGRLEKISSQPLIIIDGCHNIDGVTRLCQYVKHLNYSSTRAVVAISHDKEISSMVKILDDSFDEIIFTNYSYARSAKASELYNISTNKNKKMAPTLNDAIEEIFNNPKDITFFIGSLYLVSEVRKILKG